MKEQFLAIVERVKVVLPGVVKNYPYSAATLFLAGLVVGWWVL